MTLRRVALLQERVDMVYYSLYATMLVCFLGLMVALYSVRKDILNKIGSST